MVARPGWAPIGAEKTASGYEVAWKSGADLYTVWNTDAQGNFSIAMPPGQNYLITWWDPARSTFVTTFLSAEQPVNVVTVNPLEPATKTVTIN